MQHRSLGFYYINSYGLETRIEHASGVEGQNVGSLTSSDSLRFFDKYDEPILRSKTLDYDDAKLYRILRIADSLTIWRGFRERIVTQIIN